jgi:hypothetical protein
MIPRYSPMMDADLQAATGYRCLHKGCAYFVQFMAVMAMPVAWEQPLCIALTSEVLVSPKPAALSCIKAHFLRGAAVTGLTILNAFQAWPGHLPSLRVDIPVQGVRASIHSGSGRWRRLLVLWVVVMQGRLEHGPCPAQSSRQRRSWRPANRACPTHHHSQFWLFKVDSRDSSSRSVSSFPARLKVIVNLWWPIRCGYTSAIWRQIIGHSSQDEDNFCAWIIMYHPRVRNKTLQFDHAPILYQNQGSTNSTFFPQHFWGWPSFWQKSSGIWPEQFCPKTHISRGCPNFSPDPLDGPKTSAPISSGSLGLSYLTLKVIYSLQWDLFLAKVDIA